MYSHVACAFRSPRPRTFFCEPAALPLQILTNWHFLMDWSRQERRILRTGERLVGTNKKSCRFPHHSITTALKECCPSLFLASKASEAKMKVFAVVPALLLSAFCHGQQYECRTGRSCRCSSSNRCEHESKYGVSLAECREQCDGEGDDCKG